MAKQRKIRKSPKSDPQQYRVYHMENTEISQCNRGKLTRTEIKAALKSLCKSFDLPPVTLRFAKIKGGYTGIYHAGSITLNPERTTHNRLLTSLHEFAHYLHDCYSDDASQEAHGPEFLACYAYVLDVARVIPRKAMLVVYDMYRLRYVDPGGSLRQLYRRVGGSAKRSAS